MHASFRFHRFGGIKFRTFITKTNDRKWQKLLFCMSFWIPEEADMNFVYGLITELPENVKTMASAVRTVSSLHISI